jgi:hypothetical protein
MNYFTFILICISGLAWGFLSKNLFGHSVRQNNPAGFWGKESWLRKYKLDHINRPIPAKKSLYNKVFKLKYQERFPLSATLLVFLTDGYHLTQFIAVNSLLLEIALLTHQTLTTYLTVWIVWHVGFHLTYYRR